jgi:hypothetical protein
MRGRPRGRPWRRGCGPTSSLTTLTDAQLLVVELVTNSVRDADTPAGAVVSVRAEIRDDALRLEVEDGGRAGTVARRAPDLQRGGFGLNIVDALSRRWGVDRDAGTRVWADLDIGAVAPDKSAVSTGGGGSLRQDPASAAQLHADNVHRHAAKY